MDCPRCTRRGGWNDSLSLEYTRHVPYVRRLTIGSVRMDTADERPFSYMCVETGVGSGSVYGEESLYADKATADDVAALRCAELQTKQDKTPGTMTVAEHSRLGYFDSLHKHAEAEANRRVRDSFKNNMDGTPTTGLTPGVWHVGEGVTSDDGVYRFSIRATDPATDAYGLDICSGYGGLSSGFATCDQGPANALVIAAAPDLLRVAQMVIGDYHDDSVVAAAQAAIAKATGGSDA